MIKISQHEIPCARVKFKTPLLLLHCIPLARSFPFYISEYVLYRESCLFALKSIIGCCLSLYATQGFIAFLLLAKHIHLFNDLILILQREWSEGRRA